MQLIRRFSPDAYAAALKSWSWVGDLGELRPALATAFGDVVLLGPSGAYWFLDTVAGSLDVVWSDAATLQAAINTPEAQDRYLMAGLVRAASGLGMLPGDAEVLGFKVPPVLGGALGVENLEVVEFVVALDLAGQIHQQVRDVAPGTSIIGFSID